MNRIGEKRVISIVLLISMIISLCSCTNLFQQIFSDYVTINLDNGKLLSESDNNEQICTYRIDATVTNNYSNELKKAKVILSAPTNVDVTKEGDKATIEGVNLSVGESIDYSWIVKIPMTFENQNIDYSVTVDSDDIKPITAYASVFVKGKNKNDNRLDFSKDTWKFRNFSSKPVCLTQEDYDAMIVGLDNTSISILNDVIKDGAGGYCYGFATSSILAKMGELKASEIYESKSFINDIPENKTSKSLLAYYWMTQFFTCIRDEFSVFSSKDETEKIRILEEKSKEVENGGSPVLVCYELIDDGKEGAHAVVAYAHENGQFSKRGISYDSRILVYDSNRPNWDEDACIYYNSETGGWDVPYWDQVTNIIVALSDVNVINVKNIMDNRKSANSYLTIKDSEDVSIIDGDGKVIATVQGTTVSGNNKIVAFRSDGIENEIIISIPNEDFGESITVKSNGQDDFEASISYDNYYMKAYTDSKTSISFNSDGFTKINGNATDFKINITANEGYHSTDWYSLQITGSRADDPQISVCDDGYLVSGSDLKGLQVYADNGKTAEELKIKSSDTTILLTQVESNLCAKTDNDSDGTFETILVVGQKTDVQNPLDSSSTFHWWIIAIIIGAIAAVTGIVILIKKLFDGKPSKNKKSRKKNNNDDEWWNQ